MSCKKWFCLTATLLLCTSLLTADEVPLGGAVQESGSGSVDPDQRAGGSTDPVPDQALSVLDTAGPAKDLPEPVEFNLVGDALTFEAPVKLDAAAKKASASDTGPTNALGLGGPEANVGPHFRASNTGAQVIVYPQSGASHPEVHGGTLTFDLSPGASAPPPTLGGFIMTPFPLDPQPLSADVTSVDSPCAVPGTIDFSIPLNHRRIGAGWGSWSHGYTDDVYYTNGATEVTISLPVGSCAFYFYVEPNPFDPISFTAVGNDGTSSGSFIADGSAGAAYVGIFGDGLTSVTISTDDDTTDFAIGEFGIACECAPVFGACCDTETGICLDDIAPADCQGQFLRWFYDEECAEMNPLCADIAGACCQDDVCSELSPFDCDAAGGNYVGDGTTCDPNPCLCADFYMTAPFFGATGSTCGMGDDCAIRTTEDVVFSVQLPIGATYVFTLCNGTSYDSWLAVGTSDCCGTELGSIDDSCGLQSEIITSAGPGTVWVTIEGYSGCGSYVLDVYPLIGACCTSTECVPDVGASDCSAMGGEYLGDGSVCDINDCDENGVPDECEIATGVQEDCNGNAVPDNCDIAGGTSADVDGNGVPDECQEDCQPDGILDGCQLPGGCDIPACAAAYPPPICGSSNDCQPNGIPDECELGEGGGRTGESLLYAPSEGDDPALRQAISDALGGGTVDYFDARVATPTVAEMGAYDAVYTWVNYPMADNVAMGNNLADFVDDGGIVILGQWTLPTAGNFLSGRIMQEAGYNPATAVAATFTQQSYSGDGVACPHEGVTAYSGNYRDNISALAGAFTDGTWADGQAATCLWDDGPPVFYRPGSPHTAHGASGETGLLIANFVSVCAAAAGGGDCNGNGIPDDCDIAEGTSQDCQENDIPDECEPDCDGDGLPDECEIDFCEGTPECLDCNDNGIPDGCDITAGSGGESEDCNGDLIPDDCQLEDNDCNENGVPDDCDIASGGSTDCNDNGIPDECEDDCNENGIADACDIAEGTSLDCQPDGIPDECQLGAGAARSDPNVLLYTEYVAGTDAYAATLDALGWTYTYTSLPSEFDGLITDGGWTHIIANHTNTGAVGTWETTLPTYLAANPEVVSIISDWRATAPHIAAMGFTATGQNNYASLSAVGGGLFDGFPDAPLVNPGYGIYSLGTGGGLDEATQPNGSGAITRSELNECWFFSGPAGDAWGDLGIAAQYMTAMLDCGAVMGADCNGNGIPDDCDIAGGTSDDCQPDGVPDECQPDCQPNGVPDDCDIREGTSFDCQPDTFPDECQIAIGPPVDTTIDIYILTDSFPGETTWSLVEVGVGEIASGGPLGDAATEHNWSVDGNTGSCYEFTIFDLFGDGICCAWGIGEYTVTFDGDVVASGGQFGASETTQFGICSEDQIPGCADCQPDGICDECQLVIEPPSCTSPDTEAVIDILTDDYPSETTWELAECGVGVIASGGPYFTAGAHFVTPVDVCLDSCYTFTIFDAFGDGICCSYGDGAYTVTYAGAEVCSGGAFGTSESCEFGGGCPCSGEPIDNDCNDNGIPDDCESDADCNGDGTLDICDPDCQPNGISDVCEIFHGSSEDCQPDGVPDDCQLGGGGRGIDPTDSVWCQQGIPDDTGVGSTGLLATGSSAQGFVAWDNFTLDDSGNLNHVDWQGVYFGGASDCPGEDGFDVSIWSSAGGPDTMLMSWPGIAHTKNLADRPPIFGSNPVYDYGADLDPPFAAEAGTEYWISIVGDPSVGGCPATFGWLASPDSPPGDLLYYQDTGGGATSTDADLAFCLFAGAGGAGGADCNENGIPDDCDIMYGTSVDCNEDGVPDECQLECNDCNENLVPDDCDIAGATSEDCQLDGFPDECQIALGSGPGPCTAPDTTAVVDILTDNYPGETTWELVEVDVGVIATGGPYPDAGTLFSTVVDVCSANCYVFTIFDSFGDGICCSYGEGAYTVTFGGEVVCSGGDFGSSESCEFGTCEVAGECPEIPGSNDCQPDGIPDECQLFFVPPPPPPCAAPDAVLTIDILTDNFPSETTWELVEEDTGVVATGGPYAAAATQYLTDVPICLDNCYEWTIFDSFGDGICCAYGIGSYELFLDGVSIATGGAFGTSETVGDIACGGGIINLDCNENGVPDDCDVMYGTSDDCQPDLVPDECQLEERAIACCGDGLCQEPDEDCETCPEDCGVCPFCGDGTCDPGEDCLSCEDDCGPCPTCSDYMVTAPGVWNGVTCGAVDDCDVTASDNEDEIYQVAIPSDGTWVFSLCGSGYDTKLMIGTDDETCCSDDIGYNDDSCGLQSEITADISAGTYFVVVDGYSTACGDYTLTISQAGARSDGREDVLISQPPNQSNGIFSDCDCQFCGSGQQVLAEQFVLSGDDEVGTVRFWGGYYPGNDPGPAANVTIIIHEDGGGVPGATIATYVNPETTREQTGVVLFGVDEWVLTSVLEPCAELSAGTYWIEIVETTDATGDSFFWEAGNLDGASGLPGQAYDFACPGAAWNSDPVTDMAFELLNGPCGPPEPPANDCNLNGIPDECELDCNENCIPDDCEEEAVPCPHTFIIKQGACPAPANPGSHGVVPMLLVGGEGFFGHLVAGELIKTDLDVHDVIEDSIRLVRCDDPDGGFVVPSPGSPPGIKVKDLNHPNPDRVGCSDGDAPCTCNPDQSSDGIDDLALKFRTDEMAAAGLLDGVVDEIITLRVTADLVDGRKVFGHDCVRIVGDGSGPVIMSVDSNEPGSWVDVYPMDQTLDGGGYATFQRTYPSETVATLLAEPFTSDGREFVGWVIDGIVYPTTGAIEVTLEDSSSVRAIYEADRSESDGLGDPVSPERQSRTR